MPDSARFAPETEAPSRTLAASLDWITDDLIETTRRLWSSACGRELTDKEVIQILQNIRRLANVLLEAEG